MTDQEQLPAPVPTDRRGAAAQDRAVPDQRASRGPAGRIAAWALLLALTVLLTLWGAFLVPLRLGDLVAPVSLVVVIVGNLALGLAGARLAGLRGALAPGLLWLALVLPMLSRRAEGDLVLPGTVVALAYLVCGSLASTVAVGLSSVVRRPTHPR